MDDEIEEKDKEEREKDATPKEEDWDTPEAQTKPGNGLTWDGMIPKDHEIQSTWVVDQDCELIEQSLPWRRNPRAHGSKTRGHKAPRPQPKVVEPRRMGPRIISGQEPNQQIQAGYRARERMARTGHAPEISRRRRITRGGNQRRITRILKVKKIFISINFK